MDRYTSRAQTANEAMLIQGASNIRGVLKSAWDMACFIGKDDGNPAINAAPEMVLLTSKIASLIGCEGPTFGEFNRAWEACEVLKNAG